MPNQPKTPVRGIRVDDDLWHAAQEKAKAEDRTMTDVLVAYLKRYVSTPPRKKTARADDDGLPAAWPTAAGRPGSPRHPAAFPGSPHREPDGMD